MGSTNFVSDKKIAEYKKFRNEIFVKFLNQEWITTLNSKKKLQLLIDDLIASLDVNELDAKQLIKILQIALLYSLRRMKQVTNEVSEDFPLFLWLKLLINFRGVFF